MLSKALAERNKNDLRSMLFIFGKSMLLIWIRMCSKSYVAIFRIGGQCQINNRGNFDQMSKFIIIYQFAGQYILFLVFAPSDFIISAAK